MFRFTSVPRFFSGASSLCRGVTGVSACASASAMLPACAPMLRALPCSGPSALPTQMQLQTLLFPQLAEARRCGFSNRSIFSHGFATKRAKMGHKHRMGEIRFKRNKDRRFKKRVGTSRLMKGG